MPIAPQAASQSVSPSTRGHGIPCRQNRLTTRKRYVAVVKYRDEQNDRAGNQEAMSAPGTAPPLVEDVRIHACRDGKRPPRRVNSTTTVASGLVVPMRTILPRNASAAISPRSEGPKLKGLEPPNPDDRARDHGGTNPWPPAC